jgi:multisubunit Na+/H+ antiporter MnhG subunit
MLVLLFILILLAIAGLLGVVLKAIAFVIFVGIATAVTLAAIAYFALRHQVRKATAAMDQRSTDIKIGKVYREQDRAGDELPPPRDDRY